MRFVVIGVIIVKEMRRLEKNLSQFCFVRLEVRNLENYFLYKKVL